MSTYLKSIGALYAIDYVRRLKKCAHCGVDFSDITKRNLRHTCSDDCHVASMVAKRKARGNYVQTEESKRKKSDSVKSTWATREVFSDEVREKLSQTMKRNWAEGKIDSSNHWSKSPEGRAKISARVKGKKLGPQPKMSIAAQNRLRSKRESLYTSARGGFRSDLNCYFRSSWEANFARILNHEGKTWSYEKTTFQLEESFSYTPDFYVSEDETFFELKGRMDEKSQRQLELMSSKFPEVKLAVIDSVKYSELRIRYKNLLNDTWEGK